ncbi:N-acetylmuramoyl-L-alanine amidase family protein [Weissella confusa]
MLGKPVMTGFHKLVDGYHFETLSGSAATDAFIKDDNGELYYFDENGVMVTGKQTRHGSQYFFLPNGIALTDAFVESEDGNMQYYDKNGKLVVNQYVTDHQANAFRVDADGNVIRSQALTVDGNDQYFGSNGVQAKAQLVRDANGQAHYYAAGNGNMIKRQFILNTDGHWLYADQNGNLARGMTTINQDTLYFDDQNHQVKDDFVYDADGVHYFNGTNGAEVKNDYAYHNGKWYYFDENGRMVTGLQTINGELRYFGADGSQLKGGQATNQETHQTYVFDATNGSGQLVTI